LNSTPEEEEAEAQGVAHRAAFSTVMPEPAEGWRNSYDARDYPEMAEAHNAAHDAVAGISLGGSEVYGKAWTAADDAFRDWVTQGKHISGYESHVPRWSENTVKNVAAGGSPDNPRQRA